MDTEKQQNHPLNQLRNERPDTLVNEWRKLLDADHEQAYALINDADLEFPVLFMLRDQLEDARGSDLSLRTRIALRHTQHVLHDDDPGMKHTAAFAAQHDETVAAMYWILNTGWKKIISTDYARVIDQTAIQLLHTYHENWLKGMVDLVVYRYKNKSQRHYLISAMWETANPIVLVYMANYLLSAQNVESSFARQMMGFIPSVRHAPDNRAALLAFETWYEENAHYLVYTGETNDVVPGGHPFRIHYSAKYLGKTVSPRSGEPIQDLTAEEKVNYLDFLKLSVPLQAKLSTYSSALRRQQPQFWPVWMARPVTEQLQSSGMRAQGRYPQ